jgi:hypothetical protein
MKICDLQSGSGQLQRETKRIRDAWQQAKKSWQDGASKEFEDKYLQPLIPNIKLALAAVHGKGRERAGGSRAGGVI